MKNTSCINCGGSRLERFLDLGEQPNGNHFPSLTDLGSEPFFPMAMAVCLDCWQVQIEEFPPVEFMFANHPYITGVNMPVVDHFDRLVRNTLEKFHVPKNSLVLDIGANDGTLLKEFQRAGMRVLGIDPGKRCGQLARAAGLTVCEAFWTLESARAMKRLGLQPDLITATAVFYHVEDIHSFVRGLAELLTREGVFVAQCVYIKDVIEKFQFDHFYHEHTMIHGLTPLKGLFAKYGLRMLDVDFYDVHGGSFVLYVGREEGPYETSPSVERALQSEKDAGLLDIGTYHAFGRRVQQNRDALVSLLKELKGRGKRIFALGAPLKGSTLLNYCGIGTQLVDVATEVNRFKIGRFTPGTHIPIVYEESLDRPPDYYLVLSWNFLDFFIRKYSDYLLAGGKFIVPHPQVQTIGAEALGRGFR